jgi:SepF-like predicted cell division protein (DUF552 family)
MFISNGTSLTANAQDAIDIATTSAPFVETVEVIDEKDPNQVKQYVSEYFNDYPVLADIARCESDFRQFDEHGEILRGKVDSNDVGVMQINEHFHWKISKKLGHDIHTLKGNLEYAKYLYEEQGTKPWKASKPCWGSKSVAGR